MIFSYIVLYLICLYVDIWSNKSIYLSNKQKHQKWFTKYRVDTICDGRTDGQRQRVNIRRIQESCNILRMKMCENVLFPLLWHFFLLENTAGVTEDQLQEHSYLVTNVEEIRSQKKTKAKYQAPWYYQNREEPTIII